MPTKDKLIRKLFQAKLPRNFSKQELDTLLSQCDCSKGSGGRGSGIRFVHNPSGRILAFDEPHPGNDLYLYQVKMVREFLKVIGEKAGEES